MLITPVKTCINLIPKILKLERTIKEIIYILKVSSSSSGRNSKNLLSIFKSSDNLRNFLIKSL